MTSLFLVPVSYTCADVLLLAYDAIAKAIAIAIAKIVRNNSSYKRAKEKVINCSTIHTEHKQNTV